MILSPVKHIPLIKPGDLLPNIILEALVKNDIILMDGDILVIAQKIVSKSEGRLFNLSEVIPSDKALALAEEVQKDARLVELILAESKNIIRRRKGTLIVEHRNGFICANAGIDHSNVKGPYGKPEDWVLLLPEDADRSAQKIREQVGILSHKNVGILIIDSHGRPWRLGIIGTAIGLAGIPALLDMRGREDLFGFRLKITQEAVADELAAAASLLMGQSGEKIPVVHVRDFPYTGLPQSEHDCMKDMLRPEQDDLFR